MTRAAPLPRDELQELIEEVRRIDVLSRRLVTDVMAGSYNAAFRGSGIEFETVREYVPGDARRAVDWNVTARMGRPYVKTYVDERELTVLFLLDLSASVDAGFGVWSLRQAAARVCGCLAFSALRNNDKVGLVGFSDGVDKYVPPDKGAGHALRIVRDCLALRGAGRGTDLAAALEFVAQVQRRRAVLFVMSDFQTSGWERALGVCSRRHDVVAVRMLAPERTPPRRGVTRLRDPETGAVDVVDWGHAATRSAWTARVAAADNATCSALQRAGADRMDVPVALHRDPTMIARPILKFFRMRERRGARR